MKPQTDIDKMIAAAAELRELIREAHGAAKDLQQLLRELRALRAEIPTEAERVLADTLNTHTETINALLAEGIETVQRHISTGEQQTRQHYQELLGRDGRDLILDTCAMVLHLSVPSITIQEFRDQITGIAAQHRVTGCTCMGCITADPEDGQIYVVTDPADAPPGSVIIDGR